MVRTASLLLLFGSLTLMAQRTEVFDRVLSRQTICGPIGVQARMLDTSLDRAALPHQAVGITLNNLKTTPIVLEHITLYFRNETPTSGAPFEWETRVQVGARQEAVFAEQTTVTNPVSHIELNSVRYADGSIWRPADGQVCRVVPDPSKN